MSIFSKKSTVISDYIDQIFDLLQKNLAHIFDNFVDGKFPAIKNSIMAWRPHIDLRETEKEFILKADIPGITKQDLNIELSEDVLTISGERKTETHHAEDKYHWTERFHGKFARAFSLPTNMIDKTKIDAEFENGVLKLVLKKKVEKKSKKSAKKIDIK